MLLTYIARSPTPFPSPRIYESLIWERHVLLHPLSLSAHIVAHMVLIAPACTRTVTCKFMGKEWCENVPAARGSEEAEITQFLTHKSTPLSMCTSCLPIIRCFLPFAAPVIVALARPLALLSKLSLNCPSPPPSIRAIWRCARVQKRESDYCERNERPRRAFPPPRASGVNERANEASEQRERDVL